MASDAVIGALRVVIGADSASLDKGLDKARGNISGFGNEVSKSGAMISDAMNRIAASFGIDVGPFAKSLSSANDNMAKTSISAEKLGIVAGAALAGLAVAALAAGAAIYKALSAGIDRADEMSKAAQKFGVPIEQLSGLKYAADLADVSFEKLGVGLGKLGRNMSEVAGGATNDAARAFDALGIKVTTADGQLKTTSQVVTELADKFKGMEDGAGKTALAMAVFGRSGAELIPLLNGGGEALRQMTDEAKALGLVFDQNTGSAAERVNDAMKKLGLVFEGFSNQLLPVLVPALANLAEKLFETAKESGGAKAAADGVVLALVEMTKAAIAVYAALETVGTAIVALNAAAQLLGQGSFSAALGTIQAGITATSDAASVAAQKFRDLMDPAVNPIADAGKTQAIADGINNKITAPIIKSSEAAGKATVATDQWGRKLDEVAVKKRAMDLIVGAQEPWQKFSTEIKKADADLVAFGATQQQIGAVHQRIAEQYGNTWAQVAPAVAGSFQQIGQSFEKESKGMAKIAKIAGIAQATISLFVGAAKALELPFPASVAASAAVLAQGFALVAQIQSVGAFAEGGSFRVAGPGGRDNMRAMVDLSPGEQIDVWRPGEGGSDPRGGGAREVTIHGLTSPKQMFTQGNVREFIEMFNEAIGDGARLRFA